MAYSSCESDAAYGSSCESDTAGLPDGVDFDELGFLLPPATEALGESYREYQKWFEAKAARRRKRFETRRQKLGGSKAAKDKSWTTLPKDALKALCRKGLPAEYRAEVWWDVLGCKARRDAAPTGFPQLLKDSIPQKTEEEIQRDLHRTFPTHKKFRTAAGQEALRKVLHAYARYSPRVLYCQGLNYIAALFLIVFEDEEKAFWALVCAIDVLGVEGYYVEGMKLLRADMRVLLRIMTRKCPKVAQALQAWSVDLMAICSEWFITWFSKSLPVSAVLRVWDTLFFEGYKILFRVAIGVFKRAQEKVLRCGAFEVVMENAKSWPASMVQHNELMKASFLGYPPLRRQDLIAYRDEELLTIEQEDEVHRQRLEANRLRNEKAAAERKAKKAAEEAAAAAAATGAALAAAARADDGGPSLEATLPDSPQAAHVPTSNVPTRLLAPMLADDKVTSRTGASLEAAMVGSGVNGSMKRSL
eukprot:TRINITY_DN102923_c0_g1_i1.p1 TRINITY_DN102923_c0_g1~~TRINITY_DN102923_c0_g1_i1.p1  ORF type:complete len:488 (+),score=138.17 TRINITY_DN102923_c0_g1_i1:45-1466(+)